MVDSSFAGQYGPWALIAGGSEGIGRSFALELASRGVNLILVARSAAPLEEAASIIRGKYAVDVQTAVLDLTGEDLAQRLEALCAGKDIGMLVYNAGAVHGAGFFLDQPLARAMTLIRLNCIGPVTLVHTLGGKMKQRGRGGSVWGPGSRRQIVAPTLTAGIRGTGVYTEVTPDQRSYFCNCYGDFSCNKFRTTSRRLVIKKNSRTRM